MHFIQINGQYYTIIEIDKKDNNDKIKKINDKKIFDLAKKLWLRKQK